MFNGRLTFDGIAYGLPVNTYAQLGKVSKSLKLRLYLLYCAQV